MIKWLTTIVIIISSVFLSLSQNKLSGVVVDKITGEHLPFVNIVYFKSKHLGTTTDIDGRFKIQTSLPFSDIQISFIGYKTQSINVSNYLNRGKKLIVYLESTVYQLPNVTIHGIENPAHRIIKRAIANRKKNDPKALASFQYYTYNKFYFTFDVLFFKQADTINLENYILSDTLGRKDSTIQTIKDIKDNQYLFLMESISEKKYKRPNKIKEKVLASRVSGIQNPTFAILGTQLQSFTIYNDYISIMDKRYLSPLSKNSYKKYLFIIEDTLVGRQADTTFTLSYRPRKGKHFTGLKGILQINTKKYAIENFTTESIKQEGYSIKVQQKYKLQQDSIWFPFQLNANIFFDMNQNLNIENDSSGSLMLYGKSKTYIKDIIINPKLKNTEFNYIAIDYETEKNKDSLFWNRFRGDSLSTKEKQTYQVIDSIGKKYNFDKKLRLLSYLLTGKMPIGPFNLLLNSLLSYTNAEGFGLGLGLETNNKVLKWSKVGAYTKYTFGDKKWKYGSYLYFNLRDNYDSRFEINYSNDVKEIGNYDYVGKTPLWSNTEYRKYLVENIVYQEKIESAVELRFLYYLKARFFGRFKHSHWYNSYEWVENKQYLNQTKIPEIGLKLRYAYNEHFIKTPYGIQALPNNYPIVFFNITQAVPFQDYTTKYTKIWGKLILKKTFRNMGTSFLNIETGTSWGAMPYFEMFNGNGSYTSFDRGGGLNIFNSFGTMYFNEFINHQFVYLFYRHQFGLLLFQSKYFNPKPSIIQNIGWGTKREESSQLGIPLRDMSLGFFETGLAIDNLYADQYSEYGIALYYRYGAYAYTSWKDNLFFKISIRYKFTEF